MKALVGIAAVGIVALYAFALTFTTFGPFDDDGYFLQAYREFLSGRIPYDQIFAFYGPFTFYGGALIARFNAINVTHDNFRWALVALWIAIALLMAGIVWRWTARFSPAVIAFFLIGFKLLGLAVSNGHPQVWVILAVALLLWSGIEWIYKPRQQLRALSCGVLMAAIVLCKINIGIFICVAIALAVSLLLGDRLRMLAAAVFLSGAIGLGLMVVFAGSTISEKCFAFTYILALTITVALVMQRPSERAPYWRNVLRVVAGFGVCVFGGIAFLLFFGTTVKALFNSLIVYPALLARSYHQAFQGATQTISIVLSAAGLSTAIAVFYKRPLSDQALAWLGPLKVASGVVLLFAFIRWPAGTLTGSFLFLWLLLVDKPSLSQPDYANRVLLIVLSLLFSLQLFPVAGTQLSWAELLPIVAAALLVADGANGIKRHAVEGKLPLPIRKTALLAAPVFVVLLFLPCGKAALTRYQQWRDSQSLHLPGAYWLRLAPPQAARLTVPVEELRRHCSVVLTIPGMYSYSIWSGVPPGDEKRINSWPFMWADKVSKEDLPRLQKQDRGCVLVNRWAYQFLKTIAVSPGDDRLLSEVQNTMSPLFTLEDITLYQGASAGSVPHQ